MTRTRTVFVYNRTYVNGDQIRMGRMLVGARIAIILLVSGISFLSVGIIMKLIEDDHNSSLHVGGIANIIFGSILLGCSLIGFAMVYCQQRRQSGNCTTPYSPPIPGSYPTQATIYPAHPGVYPPHTAASFPQTLQVQTPFGYPPPYTAQQVDPTPSTLNPSSAASFSYENPAGVSDMASSLGFQAPSGSGHQKAEDGQQFPKDNPPPYSP